MTASEAVSFGFNKQEVEQSKQSIFHKMAHFTPPTIQQNDEGWGPAGMPEQFKDMPYQPFSKGDRLGKVRSHFHQPAVHSPKYRSLQIKINMCSCF